MKISFPIILLSILCLTKLGAQNNLQGFAAEFDRAEKIFSEVYQNGKNGSLTYSEGNYSAVRPLYMDLYKQDTTNMNMAFRLGVCFLNSRRERIRAIYYLAQAVTSVSVNYKERSYKERNAPIIAYKFLGDAYHLNYQFDKAIVAYGKYVSVMTDNKSMEKESLAEINRKMEMCKTGKRLVSDPLNVKIQNIGSSVNSIYADYAPVLSADQSRLFFTSRRLGTTGGKKDKEGNFMEDIYESDRLDTGWTQAKNIGVPINTDGNEATVGISPDGQTILIYKDDLGDGNIYSTTLEGDFWSKPVKLNDNINSKFWEPSAFISADGSTLYFTSNRPGGYGGRDLYTSKRNAGGDWGKAENMGPSINTPYDEDAPFIHPDGVTLFFSSNGHNTMGGFDVFSSLLSDDAKWSEPINVGYPINTTDDDIYYVVSPDSRKAYFSSFRAGGFGEKDNYMVTFLDRKETPLTLMKGIINDDGNKSSKNVEITVTDNETGQVVGVYHANNKTGQFLFILIPGKNYNITYQSQGHLFFSENMEIPRESNYYELNRAVSLDPISVGSKITLNNIFFDFDKASLRQASNVELNNLFILLKGNPNMKVEISGYTDNKGDDVYNQKLSEERAEAVVNNLIAKGIEVSRLKATGYGKTEPIAPNSKADGKDNPEGRQLNRRAELKITEIN